LYKKKEREQNGEDKEEEKVRGVREDKAENYDGRRKKSEVKERKKDMKWKKLGGDKMKENKPPTARRVTVEVLDPASTQE
jgi:hypothetical protein